MRRLSLTVGLAGLLLFGSVAGPASALPSPVVVTGAASAITTTTATVSGTVNPAGNATTYQFDYGTTTAYDHHTAALPVMSGTTAVPVSASLKALAPATAYHYRVAAKTGSTTVPGADQTFTTPGNAAASTLMVAVSPSGGDTDLATTLTIGSDPAGDPAGQASTIVESLSAQFANQLGSFGACAASSFNNAQGPTAANCPDRSAILGTGKLLTRSQAGADVASDQAYIVKTAANQIVFWWHTPAAGAVPESFGQAPGAVGQGAGLYGPVVSYDFSALASGARVKQLALVYQRNPVTGKAPFAAATCLGGSFSFQASVLFQGGVVPQLATTAVPCGVAPQPSKLQLARATIYKTQRVIDVLAPITRRASGNVSLELFAAGQRHRWSARINSTDGRIRSRESIPGAQANKGTGILTIRYAGNAVTRPQVVRLRAANVQALLDSSRPTLQGGRLRAHGTVSRRARGVVRVQLEYYSGGQTTTLERFARISNGAWTLDVTLTPAQQTAIAQRQGTVHSYILFTGYLPRQMRGEMVSYQVLGSP